MGCSSCASGGCSGSGCGNSGHCASGSCNRMNTFDWLVNMELPEADEIDVVEVTFKNGIRKEFFRKPSFVDAITGDMVAVESPGGGYDIGRVSLSGELVRLQMKKRKVKSNAILPNILRKANDRDLERLQEARSEEKGTMIHARAITAQLNLDMKVGEVEIQGDKRKATFYYTAEGRVDFRELIRIYAREFKVKIEMKQIGARQESSIIGGLGPCGRELCCSTWLTDFKSVSTGAARYQNLAINQSKLSGQCGRLKCCLNFELNTYLDALREFPKNAENLETQKGSAFLLKTDIFKRIMFFAYRKEFGALDIYPLSIDRVKEILALNRAGKKPEDLLAEGVEKSSRGKKEKSNSDEFVDGSGSLELSQLEDRRNKNKKRKGPQDQRPNQGNPKQQQQQQHSKQLGNEPRKEGNNQENQNRNPKHKHPQHQQQKGQQQQNPEKKDLPPVVNPQNNTGQENIQNKAINPIKEQNQNKEQRQEGEQNPNFKKKKNNRNKNRRNNPNNNPNNPNNNQNNNSDNKTE
jgi:cell fate regulator YaaT (PSP1 superfamily)